VWTSLGRLFAIAYVCTPLTDPLLGLGPDLEFHLSFQFAGGMKCHQTCVEKALIEESVYYPIGFVSNTPLPSTVPPLPTHTSSLLKPSPSLPRTNLYNNISTLYPNANIWLTGHSLGGAISSLLGVTFGAPTVAFESPGDRLAAGRLHLPLPPAGGDGGGITHVYNTVRSSPLLSLRSFDRTNTDRGCYCDFLGLFWGSL
jgi:hypothetical protein